MARIAMFVDGWNFYWSLVNALVKPYGWCNFALLARQQTRSLDANVTVKYFTSEDKPNPDKIHTRQATWWRALDCLGVEIIKGEFRPTYEEVEPQIREGQKHWREKMTDIALASHMIADCNRRERDPNRPGAWCWIRGYDTAVLLSQDTDFVPAAKILVAEPFQRQLYVLLPPSSPTATERARGIWDRIPGIHVVQLTKDDLARALLPRVVTNASGDKVECDPSWMWREMHESQRQVRKSAGSIRGTA